MPYTKKALISEGFSVIPARLERATHSLEGCCSIQLSYGTFLQAAKLHFFSIYPTTIRNCAKELKDEILFYTVFI
jgi:hypothetical protein